MRISKDVTTLNTNLWFLSSPMHFYASLSLNECEREREREKESEGATKKEKVIALNYIVQRQKSHFLRVGFCLQLKTNHRILIYTILKEEEMEREKSIQVNYSGVWPLNSTESHTYHILDAFSNLLTNMRTKKKNRKNFSPFVFFFSTNTLLRRMWMNAFASAAALLKCSDPQFLILLNWMSFTKHTPERENISRNELCCWQCTVFWENCENMQWA